MCICKRAELRESGGGGSAIDWSIGSVDSSESEECDGIEPDMMNVVVATGVVLNGTG